MIKQTNGCSNKTFSNEKTLIKESLINIFNVPSINFPKENFIVNPPETNSQETNPLTDFNKTKIETETENVVKSITIPNQSLNLKRGVNWSNVPLILPENILVSKIFSANQDVQIIGNERTNGMKIVIYNQSSENVTIRGSLDKIHILEPKKAVQLIYLFIINTWVII